MNIIVAGAGAGKTTSMAKTVLSRHKQIDTHKFIYVVTYTNAARDKIREKFIEENGSIPKQIHVETYHSFLLKEFIFPFHHILYGDQYVEASQVPLPSQQNQKNYKISQLKKNKQIHVEKVTEVAKWVVYGKSIDKRVHKEKRKKSYLLFLIT